MRRFEITLLVTDYGNEEEGCLEIDLREIYIDETDTFTSNLGVIHVKSYKEIV